MTGEVSIIKITDGFGKVIDYTDAVRYGWIGYGGQADPVTCAERPSPNLIVDQGRQLLAYAFAYRSPIENYVCRRFGVGTGITPAKVTDVALEAPITLASTGQITAPISTVDFLTAFKMRVSFTLALGDANGYAISEMGLFSGNSVLMARKIRSVVINKTSDWSPTLAWVIRL